MDETFWDGSYNGVNCPVSQTWMKKTIPTESDSLSCCLMAWTHDGDREWHVYDDSPKDDQSMSIVQVYDEVDIINFPMILLTRDRLRLGQLQPRVTIHRFTSTSLHQLSRIRIYGWWRSTRCERAEASNHLYSYVSFLGIYLMYIMWSASGLRRTGFWIASQHQQFI